MTRSILAGVFGLLSVAAIGAIPTACQSGGVGDPCTPEDEYDPQFSGFKVSEENIESRSFQCETRICLVNHFQGRVSCPLGQETPGTCDNPGTACGDGGTCTKSSVLTRDCSNNDQCSGIGGSCNAAGFCTCNSNDDCPNGFGCFCPGSAGEDCGARVCTALVCHRENNCQVPLSEEVTAESQEGRACCVPGTNTPIASPVCGQCASDTGRNADSAVYCSCRCDVADGEEITDGDENFNFCECPDGYECSEIRKNVGLGDKQITGKYCIKSGSAYQRESQCDQIVKGGAKPGNADCAGTPEL
jgi:hypothetical protein